jgi:hypothetical protein
MASNAFSYASGTSDTPLLGLTIGDLVRPIGICARNCAEWTITQLATSKRLGLAQHVDPRYRSPSEGT